VVMIGARLGFGGGGGRREEWLKSIKKKK